MAHYMAAATAAACYKHIEETPNAKNVCEEIIDRRGGNAGESERSGSTGQGEAQGSGRVLERHKCEGLQRLRRDAASALIASPQDSNLKGEPPLNSISLPLSAFIH